MTKNKCAILWISGDYDAAKNMILMYTLNAQLRSWWDEVHLISWGPSNKLLLEHEDLQNEMRKLLDAGGKVLACKSCAENYGIVEDLEALGIDVIYMGDPLTQYLKDESFAVLSL